MTSSPADQLLAPLPASTAHPQPDRPALGWKRPPPESAPPLPTAVSTPGLLTPSSAQNSLRCAGASRSRPRGKGWVLLRMNEEATAAPADAPSRAAVTSQGSRPWTSEEAVAAPCRPSSPLCALADGGEDVAQGPGPGEPLLRIPQLLRFTETAKLSSPPSLPRPKMLPKPLWDRAAAPSLLPTARSLASPSAFLGQHPLQDPSYLPAGRFPAPLSVLWPLSQSSCWARSWVLRRT